MELLRLGEAQLACWQAGDGHPVVVIHGAGTAGELWASDLLPLASAYRVITYSRRGYPHSSASPGHWDAHASDAAALIEACHAAPATVIGYSAGGTVALKLAMARPELVSGLILLEPVFNLRRCMTPDLVYHLAMAKLLRRLRGERRGAEHWMRYISGYTSGGSAYERKASPQRREQLLAHAGGIFADFSSAGAEVDEAPLARIGIPVTILDARLSPPFLRKLSARLHGLLPHARKRTLEHSGHWMGLDARDELLDVLRDALATTAA